MILSAAAESTYFFSYQAAVSRVGGIFDIIALAVGGVGAIVTNAYNIYKRQQGAGGSSGNESTSGSIVLVGIFSVLLVAGCAVFYIAGHNATPCATPWQQGQSYDNGQEVSFPNDNGQMYNWTSKQAANAGTVPNGTSGTWTLQGNGCYPNSVGNLSLVRAALSAGFLPEGP